MIRVRALALAAGLAAGVTGSGCNLLIGDYSIRDGQPGEIPDASREDVVVSDHAASDRSRPERPTPGKGYPDDPDAGEPGGEAP
jgi:hypothetical protein